MVEAVAAEEEEVAMVEANGKDKMTTMRDTMKMAMMGTTMMAMEVATTIEVDIVEAVVAGVEVGVALEVEVGAFQLRLEETSKLLAPTKTKTIQKEVMRQEQLNIHHQW